MAMLDVIGPELSGSLPAGSAQGDSLHYALGPCTEGPLPPSGPLLTIEPAGIVLDSFQVMAAGCIGVARLRNTSAGTCTARIAWTLPVATAALIDEPEARTARPIAAPDGACTGLESCLQAGECLVLRLTWA
jgi:hypothetical protein